jgi:adenosylmethionine-8-amino-7-oxononanoate aminotransferase
MGATRILHRDPRHLPPRAVRGEGAYLFDAEGRRYLDASGGAAVSCLGHGHPEVLAAIKRQLDSLAYAHTAFFTNDPAEALAARLVEKAPGDLGHVYFVSGGSEANETAMKLARQYAVETGQAQRRWFVSRRQSYHGNTIAALSVGGNPGRRRIYEPILLPAHHIAPCYAYRDARPGEGPEEYGRRAADELEAKLQELGPETVLAFIAETVVGATLGAVPPAPGYFRRIREVCDRHGVLLILDEVMSGMGRTGTLHACEQDGVVPDLLTCAKGLGGGYQPIGAVLMRNRIHDAILGGSGAFQHGFTYIGHATACAAGLAVQEVIERERLLERVQVMGRRLRMALVDELGDHPHVGDIRGRGLFLGVELVADRATKAPFAPERRLFAKIKRLAFADGLICYPGGGTADGRAGDHVLLAPPYIIDESHIGEIVSKLRRAIDAAVATSD